MLPFKGCTKLCFSKTVPFPKCIQPVLKCHFKIKVIKTKQKKTNHNSDFYGNIHSLPICQNLNAVIKKSASLSNFCIVTDPCPKKLEYKKRNFNACNSLWTSAPLKQSITHQHSITSLHVMKQINWDRLRLASSNASAHTDTHTILHVLSYFSWTVFAAIES